jgi:hypothetical protein
VQDIADIISDYLKNERCVILAVVPANVDFHNSQILADAKKVDPFTKRTLPVITKPDLVDEGAEGSVLDLLLGKKQAFEKGFHIVKCRGQKALNDKMPLAQSLQEEDRFFSSTKPWNTITTRSFFGIPALREKLASLQVMMIEKSIHSIIEEIKQQKADTSKELESLGADVSNSIQRRMYLNNFVERGVALFHDKIEGDDSIPDSNDFTWRAFQQQIYENFRVKFKEEMSNKIDLEDIKKTLQKQRRRGLNCFISAKLFDRLFLKYFHEKASIICRELMSCCMKRFEELLQSCFLSTDGPSQRFLRFVDIFLKDLLHEKQKEVQKAVELWMLAESQPFTTNPSFYNSISGKVSQSFEKYSTFKGTGSELIPLLKRDLTSSATECISHEIQNNLTSYINLVSDRIADILPMMIETVFFYDLTPKLKAIMYKTDENLIDLLQESSDVNTRRQLLEEKLCVMTKALVALHTLI